MKYGFLKSKPRSEKDFIKRLSEEGRDVIDLTSMTSLNLRKEQVNDITGESLVSRIDNDF